MGDKQDILVLIPAYNEGLVIGSLILNIQQYADKVIVINDGSSDNTEEIAKLAGVECLSLETNGGKAKAMMLGFKRAKELGYTATIMIDGDGQHNPAEIPKLAKPVLDGDADLVVGSRFLENVGIEEIPAYRKVGQKVLNQATNLSSGFKCSDSQSGYRALSQKALENMNFVSSGYGIESDMLSHFSDLGLTITEVPISVTYEVPHKHKMNPVKHGLSVLSGLIQMITVRKPIICFGIPGFVITAVGAVLGFKALSIAASAAWSPTITLVSLMLILMGMLLISVALILYSVGILVRKV